MYVAKKFKKLPSLYRFFSNNHRGSCGPKRHLLALISLPRSLVKYILDKNCFLKEIRELELPSFVYTNIISLIPTTLHITSIFLTDYGKGIFLKHQLPERRTHIIHLNKKRKKLH